MSIDAVIAQARRPGSFSERRRFTIARTQAIQKLRQFALADASAYILELIQAAIGNGAVWIDIQRDDDAMTLAYVGGGLPETALTRLFDYLFASKDRTDIGPLRDLAHGVNAVLALHPKKVVLVSGDGTLAGTTRLELEAGEDRFDVGRPDHPLAGTFIRAEGVDPDRGRERSLVEARCRLAPVPIVYNGESLFGFSSRKIPTLPGYRRSLAFDEGDLYGILGHEPGAVKPTLSLLTRGVVIEEVEYALVDQHKFGGVINFDALHKSADHARIVRDDRMAEMWLRVRPYAVAILRGESVQTTLLDIRTWDGAPLTTLGDARTFLHAAGRVVVVPAGTAPGSLAGDVACAIAEALSARLLVAPHEQVRSLRLLAGGATAIYTPDLTTSVDLEFYTQGPAEPPGRPWVVQPIDIPPVPLADLVPMLHAAADAAGVPRNTAAHLRTHLGETAELRARVYTPAGADDPNTAEVQLLSAGRLLLRVALPSRHAGHVVVVELPDVSPTRMLAPVRPGATHLAGLLAVAVLVHADATLAEAASRAIAGLDQRGRSLGLVEAHRALDVLARTSFLQFRVRDGQPALRFALAEPGPPGVDLLALPVLPTHAGPPASLHELAADMTAHGGLARTVPTPGALALRLDDTVEPFIRAIVGDTALDYLAPPLTTHLAPPLTTHLAPPLTAHLAPPNDLSNPPGTEGPVPAAIDAAGRTYTLAQLRTALAAGRPLLAGHADEIPHDAPPGDDPPDELRLTPAAFLALAPLGAASAFDFDFDDDAFAASVPVRTAEVDGVLGVPLADPAHPAVIVLDETRRAVHRYVELAHDFGVVGVLRLRTSPWSDERAAVVAGDVAAATGHLYDQLLARLPVTPQDSPAFTRAAAAVLGYAGRRIALVADPHGRVTAHPVQATADRVLGLPLFAGRRGVPLSAWHLVRRFAAAGGDPEAALAELDLPGVPAVLRDWIARTLVRARIAATDAATPADARTPGTLALARDGSTTPITDDPPDDLVDDVTLATTLEYWLHALRPDLPPADRPWDRRGRVRLLVAGDHDPRSFAEVDGDAETWSITLHPDHWLLRRAAATARRDREPLAWLLLACYARINEHFDDVTNLHEGEFQRSVADALEHGHLDLVTPRA